MFGTTMWSGHQMMDPQELENRFSTDDGMGFMDSIFEEPTEEALELVGRVREIMEDLPDREADFVDLYYFKNFKQTDIARLFGVSQPTVCYRLQRATARIHFLLQLPRVSVEEMEEDLAKVLPDDLDIKIMVLMYNTTCQSEVAKQLEVSQGLVRHRFIRSIERMRDDGGLDLYVKIFTTIAGNLNILREVQRPSWNDRVTHTLV